LTADNTSDPPRDFNRFIYVMKGTQDTGGIWVGHVQQRKRLALIIGGPGWAWGVSYFASEAVANEFLDYWEGKKPLAAHPPW